MVKSSNLLRIIIAVTVVCFYSPSGGAAAQASRFPEHKSVSGKNLVLNGTGTRDEPVYHAKVYEAGLYLEEKSKNPRRIIRDDTVKHLELHFLRKARHFSVRKSWEEGFEKQAGQEIDKYRTSIEKLASWTTSVGAGDTYQFTYIPKKGLEIRVKNQLKGVIADDDFSRVFFSIWLGREPVNRDLKAGLLGR